MVLDQIALPLRRYVVCEDRNPYLIIVFPFVYEGSFRLWDLEEARFAEHERGRRASHDMRFIYSKSVGFP